MKVAVLSTDKRLAVCLCVCSQQIFCDQHGRRPEGVGGEGREVGSRGRAGWDEVLRGVYPIHE